MTKFFVAIQTAVDEEKAAEFGDSQASAFRARWRAVGDLGEQVSNMLNER